MKTGLALIQAMRPKHYIKNVLIFVPVFFAGQFLDAGLLLSAFLAFVFFCLLCSAVYLANDLIDYPYDINHPVKKNRPIASGRLGRTPATIFAVLLATIALVGLFMIGPECGLISSSYLILNIAYSFWLKRIPLLDAFCVAIGFTLRVFVGAAAVSVVVSHWLFLTILCLSLFLAFGKRRNEMLFTTTTGETRKVLDAYNANFLDKTMFAMMTLTITFYSLWVVIIVGSDSASSYVLMATIPLIILALLRYMSLIETATSGDPTTVILDDKFLLIIAGVVVVFMGLYLYFIG